MQELISAKHQALMLLEEVLLSLGSASESQFLQDSPIRMSVWHSITTSLTDHQQLLLTPNNKLQALSALSVIKRSFDTYNGQDLKKQVSRGQSREIIALPSTILVSATATELFQIILPLTVWGQRELKRATASSDYWDDINTQNSSLARQTKAEEIFAELNLKPFWRLMTTWAIIETADERASTELEKWQYIQLGCSIVLSISNGSEFQHEADNENYKLLKSIIEKSYELSQKTILNQIQMDNPPIWSINLNRTVELSVYTSRKTAKFDAAEKLFECSGEGIRWAVVDSGIDATHPAFRDRNGSDKEPFKSRIIATYDFTRLNSIFRQRYQELVSKEVLDELSPLVKKRSRRGMRTIEDAILTFLYLRNSRTSKKYLSSTSLQEAIKNESFLGEVKEYVEDVKRRLKSGQLIDWSIIEPLLRVSHELELYRLPSHGHGTHVAGILAGDLKRGELTETDGPAFPEDDHTGMCPQMQLYDLRVCGSDGKGNEFVVLAALQFIEYLNREHDRVEIHGANLSLSLHHSVREYACGQTPVCKEANRIVSTGVVVVTAAGNRGFQRLRGETSYIDAYGLASITDPGNAADVITVGATYRDQPHTYGVSYFSSRGPTGDGRMKPDLIAPGERIFAPVPNRKLADMTGTSMAAPHVSGAAALLMQRNSELVGRPARIKEILCSTATNIGRLREFQGAGVLDVLRAMQSV